MNRSGRPINLLPGPVAIHDAVLRALARPPVSHRSPGFLAEVAAIRRDLCRLTGARHVEILLGSGTLANEAVAAQLSLLPGHGVVLVNGEFGSRLSGQAGRWRLPFRELAAGWGEPLPLGDLRRALEEDPEIRWVWAVHCETSTGVLNDLAGLAAITRERGAALCLDAVSSIGNVPVDLSQVHLATGVSGKGLASFPGLALVFHAEEIAPAPHLPHYLDLGSYARSGSVPFTTSTNLGALGEPRPPGPAGWLRRPPQARRLAASPAGETRLHHHGPRADRGPDGPDAPAAARSRGARPG